MKHDIKSSMINSLNREDGMLEVEFNNGKVYQYPDIKDDEFDALLNAESIGKYFNSVFRAKEFKIKE